METENRRVSERGTWRQFWNTPLYLEHLWETWGHDDFMGFLSANVLRIQAGRLVGQQEALAEDSDEPLRQASMLQLERTKGHSLGSFLQSPERHASDAQGLSAIPLGLQRCCDHEQKGCAPMAPASLPYDCAAGYSNWHLRLRLRSK